MSDDGAMMVTDVMLRAPKLCGPGTTVADARRMFDDDHLHCLLVVAADGSLLAVVDRADLRDAEPSQAAVVTGRVAERVIGPGGDAEAVRRQMVARGWRRLAVVDERGRLLGLLCLKRTGLGFCSDADVAARAADSSNRP
jgi:CBS domain-containing protein